MSTPRLVADPEREAYAAARGQAAVLDRSDRGRVRIAGAKAREMLAGLVTNDIAALADGAGCYAAALTAKGRIITDMRVFAFEADVIVDTPPRGTDSWLATLRKFVNPRVAPWRDESEPLGQVALLGPKAADIAAAITGIAAADLAALPPYAHHQIRDEGFVANVPDFGVPAWEMFLPAAAARDAAGAARAAGAVAADRGVAELLRIEAGRPELGVDMDDSTLAQEANMETLDAISFTKGCYVGQETVARIHFRGHVNRHLRGLRFESDRLPPRGATLADAAGKTVGDVRSTVHSPRLGPIAIAMVRREVENGASLAVTWEDGTTGATVVPLPFPA